MNGHHEVAFQDKPPQYEQPQRAWGVGVGEDWGRQAWDADAFRASGLFVFSVIYIYY